jgi:hypothetical protein
VTAGTVPYRQRGLASGYRYQDLIAALAMARVLAEGAGSVAVEEKRFAGDAFDDIELIAVDGTSRRVQVKHREARGPLTIALFEGDADGLRLDALVAAEAANGGTATGSELRIVTTLDASAAATAGFIIDPETRPFVPGLRATRWRISVDAVWPEGADEPRFVFENKVRRYEVADFCRRLVVEADAMPMSGQLANPGELERALIERLRSAVGVEQYPNRAKAIDVAARVLEVAFSLRTRRQRRLDFDSIAAECGLRVDRGRIAQAFPLDRRRYVPAVPLRGALVEALQPRHHHQRIIVKGSPGAGKSWALEALSQDLRAADVVVARHYCFLAPGDPDVAQRVAVETLTANLIAELLDDPRLSGVDAGLGGGVDTLELALTRADEAMTEAGLTDRIVLFVDGLDHAARIEPAPGSVAASPDDLTAQLGLLELPDRVTLVVGSQPGTHLDTLVARGAHEIAVPPLQLRHTAALLARQGTLRALKQHGFADTTTSGRSRPSTRRPPATRCSSGSSDARP